MAMGDLPSLSLSFSSMKENLSLWVAVSISDKVLEAFAQQKGDLMGFHGFSHHVGSS